jgi:hypothetical protein
MYITEAEIDVIKFKFRMNGVQCEEIDIQFSERDTVTFEVMD